jgi:hypothetical protein
VKSLFINPKEKTKYPAESQGTPPSRVDFPDDLSLYHLQLQLARVEALVKLTVVRWQRAGRDPNDAFRGLVITDGEANQLLAMPFSSSWGDLIQEVEGQEIETLLRAQAEADRSVQMVEAHAAAEGRPLRFQQLVERFELDAFSVDALLICIAPSLDLRFEQLYSYLQNDINRKRPSVNLVLNLLCPSGPARLQRMNSLNYGAPLLRYRLIEAVVEPASAGAASLLAQALQVDRAVIGWLLGEYQLPSDLRLGMTLAHVVTDDEILQVTAPVQPHLQQAARVTQALLLFWGADTQAQHSAARMMAALLQRPLMTIHITELVAQGNPLLTVLRMGLRDARLNGAVAFVDGWDICLQDQEAPLHLLEEIYSYPGTIVVAGTSAWQPTKLSSSHHVISLEFDFPDYPQRKRLWQHYLHDHLQVNSELDPVEMAGRFTLTTRQIQDTLASAVDLAIIGGDPLQQQDLYAAARRHSGTRLAELARKITPRYDWDDIILPADQVMILRELVATVRSRSKVLEEWGVGRKLASSAAVTVLFAGPPGTGKTMAAEVIAKDLALDLYKIDLSSLVSKYIGDTEKNLERIFTEAQSSNAILFFDEADAIFGKRSGVKDARDRYANIEVSYLLQRMETYDGVTVLATNLRSNIDEAFMRRLQFAVDVPFPDEKDRLRIWQTLFPDTVPKADDVDFDDLARRFKLAGGNIRNIIVGAAYLAATDNSSVTMQHLLHSARREFQKMGRLVMDN